MHTDEPTHFVQPLCALRLLHGIEIMRLAKNVEVYLELASALRCECGLLERIVNGEEEFGEVWARLRE